MSWNEDLTITLTFSEHNEKDHDGPQLILEYSTSTEDTEIAEKQARNLADRHLKNVDRAEIKVHSTHYARHNQTSIVIKGLTFGTPMVAVENGKWLVLVQDEEDYQVLSNILRLPLDPTGIEKTEKDKEIEIRIPTKIESAYWERTVGTSDRIKLTRSSNNTISGSGLGRRLVRLARKEKELRKEKQ